MTRNIPGQGLLGEDRFIQTSDGRQLRLMLRGEGPRVVVLEAGMGFSGLYWDQVHRLLGEKLQVIAYERSGFGASDPDPGPRTLARLAEDLNTVIAAVPHREIVLVGHSYGGPIIRQSAAQRRQRGERTDGLVLVDQADENSDLYFSRLSRLSNKAQALVMPGLAWTHLLGPLIQLGASPLERPLRQTVAAASSSPATAAAAASELRHFTTGMQQLRSQSLDLGPIPIRVISGQQSPLLQRSMRKSLIRAHRATASIHHGRYVPAHRSGHLVPFTEPDLIAAEVQALFGRGQYRRPCAAA